MSIYQVMPPLSAEEYEALKADIAAHGITNPIVVDELGTVIDGHNRQQIAGELGLKDCPRTIMAGLAESEKRLHARRLNLLRRHLTQEQRREQIRAQLSETPELSNRVIATALGVDDKTVGSVRLKMERTAEIPQLEKTVGADGKARRKKQLEIQQTKPITVINPSQREERILKNPAVVERMQADSIESPVYAQRKINQEAKFARKNKDVTLDESDYQFIPLKIETGLPDIPDKSVDLLVCDPPYEKAAIPLYGHLSALANRVLKDTGSLLVMCGSNYLPEFIQELSRNMRYWWMLSYLTPSGGSTELQWKRVFTYQKPVLWFVKNKYTGDMIYDVISAPPDKDKADKNYHEWGQSEYVFKELIERFTDPGQTVLDPFVGGGACACAAARLNRKVIAADKDDAFVELTRNRVIEILENKESA